ncbi:RelA/SpoT domain-containing protein [Succinivibrio sp.]|uniref:RelA/SpoT domain-containing protein n=1 Tax=Succinivibrio sp. TaxID=2053619 RepID=UPI0038650929
MSDKLNIPSNKSIQKAGEIIRKTDENSLEYHDAYVRLSEWRNLHAIPLKSIQISVKKRLNNASFKNYLIGQRLKRMPSIIGKIIRFPDMSASRMQDVGGLRIIVPSIDDVNRVHSIILKNRKNSSILRSNNYILSPKKDGYRSLHQVFRYVSPAHPELNGYCVEVQIRTKLQHSWATAVETLGMINLASYKTGEGDELSRRFFLLISALFAIKEHTPVPESLKNMSVEELIGEVKSINQKLGILSKLNGLVVSISEKKIFPDEYYYVLELTVDDSGKGNIKITSYKEESGGLAEQFYRFREEANKDNLNVSVLMIRAESFRQIKKAYPNYFLDTKLFLGAVNEILNNGINYK